MNAKVQDSMISAVLRVQSSQDTIAALDAESAALKELLANLGNVINGDYGGGGGNKSSGKDLWKEEFEDKRRYLQHQLKMQEITQQQYYDGLAALDKKYYAGNKKYITEHWDNLEELHELSRTIFSESAKDVEHEIFLLAKREGTEKDQIALYKQIQDELNRVADSYRAMGLSENHNYIEELKTQWWRYQDEIDKLNKQSIDKFNDYLSRIEKAGGKLLENERRKIEQERKRIQAQMSQTEGIVALEKGRISITNEIASAQRELSTVLKVNMESYKYLDEESKKTLLNEKDFDMLSKKLGNINAQADSLYNDYLQKINDLTVDNASNAEFITREYERQNDALMKGYKIALDELNLEKERLSLRNTLNERNVKMFMRETGTFQWVADPNAVKDALQSVAEAEDAVIKSKQDLQDTQIIQRYERILDSLKLQEETITKSFEALEEQWRLTIENIKELHEPTEDLTSILKEIAENQTPELQSIISQTTEAVRQFLMSLTNATMPSYGQSNMPVYDSGGVLHGIGGIKATRRDEVVLGPDLTSKWLEPKKSSEFTALSGNLIALSNLNLDKTNSVLSKFNDIFGSRGVPQASNLIDRLSEVKQSQTTLITNNNQAPTQVYQLNMQGVVREISEDDRIVDLFKQFAPISPKRGV